MTELCRPPGQPLASSWPLLVFWLCAALLSLVGTRSIQSRSCAPRPHRRPPFLPFSPAPPLSWLHALWRVPTFLSKLLETSQIGKGRRKSIFFSSSHSPTVVINNFPDCSLVICPFCYHDSGRPESSHDSILSLFSLKPLLVGCKPDSSPALSEPPHPIPLSTHHVFSTLSAATI